MKALDKGMLVRGKITIGNNMGGSSISESNPLCITAVTHWYRHDDDLSRLERDFGKLKNAYASMDKTSGFISSYEYKEYK